MSDEQQEELTSSVLRIFLHAIDDGYFVRDTLLRAHAELLEIGNFYKVYPEQMKQIDEKIGNIFGEKCSV